MWANKGEVMCRPLKECPAPDFLLAAGDDRTDEDLFARLPATAWTIHVGENESGARFRLPGPEQVCRLLREGAVVRVERGATALKGSSGARIFRKGREPVETSPGDRLDRLIFADHSGND